MSKRSPKKRRRTLPALGLASVSLSMASGACAVIGEVNASTPPQQTHEIFLAEEEISDVSLATFYVFDKEKPSPLQLARGGCGGDTCWIWTPSGWIYSCSSNASPTSEG
jgi:hypothetical protein